MFGVVTWLHIQTRAYTSVYSYTQCLWEGMCHHYTNECVHEVIYDCLKEKRARRREKGKDMRSLLPAYRLYDARGPARCHVL